MYGNTVDELFYKTRSTSRSISTQLCVVILQMSSSTRQGAPVGVYLPCCVCQCCRGALLHDNEHQSEYIYPVVCVNTAEVLFYKTRSTSRSISTLLCVLLLQRSSSTRQGAPVVVYLPCCVCKYCRGALLQDKEHQYGYIYPLVCGNTQRSSSTRQGAPVGVYLPCCVC